MPADQIPAEMPAGAEDDESFLKAAHHLLMEVCADVFVLKSNMLSRANATCTHTHPILVIVVVALLFLVL